MAQGGLSTSPVVDCPLKGRRTKGLTNPEVFRWLLATLGAGAIPFHAVRRAVPSLARSLSSAGRCLEMKGRAREGESDY